MGKHRSKNSAALLEPLNPVQRAAVQCTEGPVLIVAGAGSGKTRVLTHRVAYLIESLNVNPWEILAVTFTNKAAQEMKERILQLTGGVGKEAWIGTFHSVCARILRVEGHLLGFSRNFSIFDRHDQLRFIKNIMEDINIPTKQFPPEAIVRRISGAKNMFVSPDEYKSIAKESFEETVSLLYSHYQIRLKENNIMDFDDLLVKPILIFEQFPEVLERYQKKIRYVLVDEFQDTNRPQYLFLRKLVAKNRNLCVVGDDDQSIYRWRGADIRNILNLEKDFSDCKVFNLEQNYRSTKHILSAANSVVSKNSGRRVKSLWTEKENGAKVTIFSVDDAAHESFIIVERIKEELSSKARDFSDFAVLYRTNSQSRVLEDALRTAAIPYKLVGGVRFYERKEIKDVLAYLRLLCNPKDPVSFKRIINFPLRGIGETSVARIEQFARDQSLSLLDAAGRVEEIPAISSRIRKNITDFYTLIEKYASLKSEFSAGELARALVDEIGILRIFKEIATEESYMKAENVRELLAAIEITTADGCDLDGFLEEVALITDIDAWNDKSNAVTLMTLHSAKGLEFPTVFIAGLEEGLFPLSRSQNDHEDLQEERRLFYVGATRAKERLYLTSAAQRLRFGETFNNVPSRFLKEMDSEFVLRKDLRGNYRPRQRYNRPEPESQPVYEDFSQEIPQLYVGTEVNHQLFGVGRILKKEGHGENMKITVNFYDAGKKKLVVKYANLKILN